MDLMDYLESATKSLFRYEGLQEYEVEDEDKSYKNFLAIGKVNTSDNKEWYEFIDKKIKQDVSMQRVRKIKMPLTQYTKYELPYHYEATKRGDDIRIILEDTFNGSNIVELKDFWLIDDKTLLLLDYDRDGKYLGFNVVEGGIDLYEGIKNSLIEHSISLKDIIDIGKLGL